MPVMPFTAACRRSVALLKVATGGLGVLLVASCAVLEGRGGDGLLFSDAVRVLGEPAMQWRFSSGARQLAYPPGPAGLESYMVYLAPDGSLNKIEGVLDDEHFSQVVIGRSDRDTVLRLLGPPRDRLGFERRNEETWVWRFRDARRQTALYLVLFDTRTWTVKEALQVREPYGGRRGD